MSTELRTIHHVPEHPRWCSEGADCSDFKPNRYMFGEHLSEPVTFHASGDDTEFRVGTARVDTGDQRDDGKLTVEIGRTEVHLTLKDTGSVCDCGRDRLIATRLSRSDVTHLINLLTTADELALARQLLDLKQFPL